MENPQDWIIVLGEPSSQVRDWLGKEENRNKITAFLDPGRVDFSPPAWREVMAGRPTASRILRANEKGTFDRGWYEFLAHLILEVPPARVGMVQAQTLAHGSLLLLVEDFLRWYLSRTLGVRERLRQAETFVRNFAADPVRRQFYTVISLLLREATKREGIRRPPPGAARDADREKSCAPGPAAEGGPWRWALLHERWEIYLAQAESLVAGWKACGEEGVAVPVLYVKEAYEVEREGSAIFLQLELALARPHVVLTINTLWPYYDRYLPTGARKVSWTQDILFHREEDAGTPPFFLDRAWVKLPHHRYWPIAADEVYVRAGRESRAGKIGTNPPEGASEPGSWESDFSYVGKLPPCYPVGERSPRVDLLCESYLAILFAHEWFGSQQEEADLFLHEAEKRTGITLPGRERDRLLHHCRLMIPRFAQRARLVSYLLGRGVTSLRLFGEGWDWEKKFLPFARGELRPGPEIAAAYRRTRINLHLNGDTNVHQRVFECLAVGGFLMAAAHPSDDRPGGLFEFLTPGREIVIFHNLDECWTLARYYLAHEDERLAIAAAGQARVLLEHTYAFRLRRVIDEVKRQAADPGLCQVPEGVKGD